MLPREIIHHIFKYQREYWYFIPSHTLLSLKKVNSKYSNTSGLPFMIEEHPDDYWINGLSLLITKRKAYFLKRTICLSDDRNIGCSDHIGIITKCNVYTKEWKWTDKFYYEENDGTFISLGN